ncbi:MAG: Flp family type IVb pilin [Sulfuriferula sp.]|jgi:pilus assembly protein Flp/PilA|nr:Flp family type IVb pilin [Sulfuriferula sp.]
MRRIQSGLGTLLQDESGVTAIEYALVASLIAVVILSAIATLGNTLQALWDRVAGCVANPSSCA